MATLVDLKPQERVVAATGLSNLADGIRYVALPLLVLEITSSPFVLAAVIASSMAPWLLFGLWAGRLTDQLDRRLLAQRVALARVALLAMLGLLILVGAVPIPLVLLAAFVLGLSEVVADNVNSALIPSIVPEDELERANSRMIGAEVLGNELLGPAFGGLIFAVAASLPFFTNAGLLAAAFLLLSGLPLLQAARSGGLGDTEPAPRAREGISAIRSSLLLRAITSTSALLAAVDGAWFALVALLITREFDLSASALGVFLAIGAVGGLAGAAVADRAPNIRLPSVAAVSFVGSAVPLLVLSLWPSPPMAAIVLVVTSGTIALWNVFVVSARQRASAPDMLGRIGAAYRTTVVAAGLVGTLLGGAIAERFSVRTTLAASAIVLCLAAPAALTGLTKVAPHRQRDRTPK